MTWTGRSDSEPCCGDDPGPIKDAESIIRLIHSQIEEPDHEPFKRSELQKKEAFSNACGDAHGCSIIRADGVADEDVVARSVALADIRPGRVGRGGLKAQAGRIRQVRIPGDENQVCFLYDDPRPDDDRHGVIRVREDLSRPRFDEVRLRLRNAFVGRILPDQVEQVRPEDDVVISQDAFRAVLPQGR